MTHWYDTTGKPVHTIIGSNGKRRDTTLRDARKYGHANGVTGFLDLLHKQRLIDWMQDQLLEAAIRNKPGNMVGISKEVTTLWKKQVLEESRKIGKDSSAIGSKIHNALEEYIKTGDLSGDNENYKDFVTPVIDLLQNTFGETDWIAEKSFYHPLGFGGTIDLHSPSKKIVIDFKTKKDKAFTKKMGYDSHMMQLAAYGSGLGFDVVYNDVLRKNVQAPLEGEYYNLFISSETPGIIILEQWDIEDVRRGQDMFYHLVEFWKLSKQYNPRTVLAELNQDKVLGKETATFLRNFEKSKLEQSKLEQGDL